MQMYDLVCFHFLAFKDNDYQFMNVQEVADFFFSFNKGRVILRQFCKSTEYGIVLGSPDT